MSTKGPAIRLGPMFEAVQGAARAGRLTLALRCEEPMRALGYDAASVMEILAEMVEQRDVVTCEPCDDPKRHCHVMAFEVAFEDEPVPIYIKVALQLPNLLDGTVLSFHLSR